MISNHLFPSLLRPFLSSPIHLCLVTFVADDDSSYDPELAHAQTSLPFAPISLCFTSLDPGVKESQAHMARQMGCVRVDRALMGDTKALVASEPKGPKYEASQGGAVFVSSKLDDLCANSDQSRPHFLLFVLSYLLVCACSIAMFFALYLFCRVLTLHRAPSHTESQSSPSIGSRPVTNDGYEAKRFGIHWKCRMSSSSVLWGARSR